MRAIATKITKIILPRVEPTKVAALTAIGPEVDLDTAIILSSSSSKTP